MTLFSILMLTAAAASSPLSTSAAYGSAELLRRVGSLEGAGSLVTATLLLDEWLGGQKNASGDDEQQQLLIVLEAAARVARKAKRHKDAHRHRMASAALKGRLGASVFSHLRTAVELATDLRLEGRFAAALRKVRGTAVQLGGELPGEAIAVLHRLSAQLYDCRGDYDAALASLDAAAALEPQPPSSGDLVRERMTLLRRRRHASRRSSSTAPEAVDAALAARETRVGEMILARGPGWRHLEQTPHEYDAVLGGASTRAHPWHTAMEEPSLGPAIAILAANWRALREEYDVSLRDSLAMVDDEDCIAEKPRRPGRTRWRRYEISGVWMKHRDAEGCSEASPVACRVLRELRAVVEVARAGYSVVEGGGTWIRPHVGPSNKRLKLHLGLRVPGSASNDSGPCVAVRAGNETRSWTEGGVLLLDDSFVHEVWNDCDEDAERVIFQVVVRHPLLQQRLNYAAIVVDA